MLRQKYLKAQMMAILPPAIFLLTVLTQVQYYLQKFRTKVLKIRKLDVETLKKV